MPQQWPSDCEAYHSQFQIAVGHVDLADILFLVALFICCCIIFVVRVMVRPFPLDGALMAAAIGLIALAWFVL